MNVPISDKNFREIDFVRVCVFYQDKLQQEEYKFVSTEEEREEISKKLSEASNWMEEEGYTATTKVGASLWTANIFFRGNFSVLLG